MGLFGLGFCAAQGHLYYAQTAKTFWKRFCFKLVQRLCGKDILRFNLVQNLYGIEIPSDLPSSLTFNGYYPRSAVPSINKQLDLLVGEFAIAIQEIFSNSLEANVLLNKSLHSSSQAERISFAEQAIAADNSHPDLYFNLAILFHSITGRCEGPYADFTAKGLQVMAKRREQHQPDDFAINGRILNHKWTVNIGHIAVLDLFIKAHRLKLLPENHYSLITTSASVANASFLSLFDAHIPIAKFSPGMYWLMHNRFFSSYSELLGKLWITRQIHATMDL